MAACTTNGSARVFDEDAGQSMPGYPGEPGPLKLEHAGGVPGPVAVEDPHRLLVAVHWLSVH
jgi:hypothetical protein